MSTGPLKPCERCGQAFPKNYRYSATQWAKARFCSTACRYGTLAERFWEKVEKTDGCWLWTASLTNKGYGEFRLNEPSPILAHRVAYELAHGPIPPGLFVCHHCDNPPCVRPDHLFLGTQKDNAQDMVRKGRHANTKKTHCKHGHPFTSENTGRGRNGSRTCITCARTRHRRYEDHRAGRAVAC